MSSSHTLILLRFSACSCQHPPLLQGHRHAQRDISNKNLVNPIGILRSASFLLHHIGEDKHAIRLTQALDNILQEGRVLPRDVGGRARTSQVADEVVRQLELISRQQDR